MASDKQTYQVLTMRMIKTITLIACLSALQYLLVYKLHLGAKAAFVDSISLFALSFLFINLIYTVQRYYHSKIALNTANLSSIALFAALTILGHYFISYGILGHKLNFLFYLNQSIFFKSVFVVLVYIICMLVFWIDQQRVQEKRIQDFAIEKERESIRIELNSIQQQFKPHFLFNSLNSINALTISNPEEARRMVHLLSEFMRAAVRENQSEFVELKQEIHHIQLYTDIEKVRFGSRLTVNYEIEEDAYKLKLPSLILQPIIENAVKYGLYGHTDNVTITIHARAENTMLSISVTNPYDAGLQSTVKGTGYGLQSIEKKMLILYNRANLLTIETADDMFTANLNIPQL